MIFPLVEKSGFTHSIAEKNVSSNGDIKKYGRYLPTFVLVLSAITPMIGSFIASQNVEINMISDAAAAGIFIVSVIKTENQVARIAAMHIAPPLAEVA